jgi:potassium-dependent mechanosensitive channel
MSRKERWEFTPIFAAFGASNEAVSACRAGSESHIPRAMQFSRTALSAALIWLIAALSPAWAQAEVKAQLDEIRTGITSLERDVAANSGDSAALGRIRGQVEPLLDRLRDVIGAQTPRLDGIKARLEQLGPKPDASKDQTDNPDVARERDEQTKAQQEAEGLLALARNHVVALEQLTGRIADLRRGLLTKALLERTSSVLSPVLWLDVMRAVPGEVAALGRLFSQTSEHFLRRVDTLRLGILAAFAALIGIILVPGHRYLQRFEARPSLVPVEGQPAPQKPSRKQKALAALRVTVIWAVAPVLVALAIYNLVDAMDLLPDRLDDLARRILFGIAFVAFAHGLADGILAPDDPGWRLVEMDDRAAEKIAGLAKLFPAIIVAGKVMEALNQAIYAVLPVSVLSKALFALIGGLAIIRTLRQQRTVGDEEAGDAQAAVGGALHPAVRLAGWASAIVIIASAAFGFVALASFLQDQVIWLAMVGGVLLIVVALVDEYIGHGVSPEGPVGKQVMAQVGLSRSSLKQISILSNGFLRMILFIAAAMLVLAPWGLDRDDTFSTLRAALFGFTVGGVTISISTIILAIAMFFVGFTITKAIKGWLERTYLPATKLDIGLRNSIATSIGYIGIIGAAMAAASTLGLSLDRFTIVAGALSVGIGFGLQSIVNNFVSGLILLWERPIRVGDWIVVGDEQGIVKKINVRSTQIETFDRASLIVPNAEFISGRVKNWMHNDRTARIVVPVGVGYGSDPDTVRKILVEVAKANKDVLKEPHPRVYFMRLGDSSMEFELRCFADVDFVLPVKSELLFQVHKALTKARIDIPMPRRPRELLIEEQELDQGASGQSLDAPASDRGDAKAARGRK